MTFISYCYNLQFIFFVLFLIVSIYLTIVCQFITFLKRALILHIILLFSFSAIEGIAQKNEPEDSCLYYYKQASENTNDNPDLALQQIKKAYHFRNKNPTVSLEKLDLINGKILTQLRVLDSSQYYLNRALKSVKKNQDTLMMINCMHALALNLDSWGRSDDAVKAYFEVIDLAEAFNQKKVLAAAYCNVGIIFHFQGNYDRAEKIFLQVLEIDSILQDTIGLASDYSNLAGVYGDQKLFEKSLVNYKKALDLSIKTNSLYGQALSYGNIGSALADLKKYDEAISSYNQSISVYDKMGYEFGKIFPYRSLGSIYRVTGKLNQSLDNLKMALKIVEETDDVFDKVSIYKELALTYNKLNQPQQAYDYLYKHLVLNDSILRHESVKQIAEMETKYQTEQKEQSIKLKNAEIAVEKANNKKHVVEAKQRKQQLYYLFGGLALAIFLGLFIFNRFRLTRKQKKIIEIQKKRVDKAFFELEEKNQEIMDSIHYAKRIQSAILPPDKVVKEYLVNSFIFYKPKDVVAGDFYWLEHKDNKILFAACDCTGHGVPGAMVSVVCVNGLNRSVREDGLTDPGKILDRTREIVIEEFEKSEEEVKDGMDISLCCLSPFESTSTKLSTSHQGSIQLKWAGANNPLWIIRNGTEEIEEIKANKQPIGKYAEPMPFTTHTIDLQQGDSIYIFSDGFADQFGGDRGKKFKTTNFKKLLVSIQGEPMIKQKAVIDEAFEKWRGKIEQIDDVCVIGVKI